MKNTAINLGKFGVILASILLSLSISCTADDSAPYESLEEANIMDINLDDNKEPEKQDQ